jgi:MFS transporter, MHS family, metabolite:H+ symporter
MSRPVPSAQQKGAPERSLSDLRRAAVSGWLGTSLEYLDFQLYGLAAALIFNEVFFPEQSPAVALMASFGTYAVGFFARPVGAWFFGRMGDRLGRKKVLVVTIAVMGLSTTLIGALPSHAQIGVLAPVLLTVLRLVQGFGAGAELAGASVLLSEYAPPARRGLVASLVCLGTNTGTLLASGIWALLVLLPEDQLFAWGWRVPFLASLVVTGYALWLRRNLKESPVFEHRAEADRVPEPAAAGGRAGRRGRAFFVALGLRMGESGNSAIFQSFLVGYLATGLLMDRSVGTTAILVGSVIGFGTVPLFGLLSDRLGRRTCYRLLAGFQILFAFPAMLLVLTRNPVAAGAALVIGLSVSVLGMYSVQSAYLAELFGARNRYTQMALAKEIGGILSGGIAPLVAAALLAAFAGQWWIIPVYMIFYAALALVATFFSPETKGRDLTISRDATQDETQGAG